MAARARLTLLASLVGALVVVLGASAAPRATWAVHDLGTLPAPFDASSYATAIDAHGVVIGVSSAPSGAQRAFVWADGRMRALPGFGGDTTANAIAGEGEIGGEGLDAHQTHHHAILWHDGRLVDLGTLGGRMSRAVALNDHGQVVGDSTTAAGDPHAFLWQDGVMTDLGTLGGTQAHAVAIDEAGAVIGTSETGTGAVHAFVWRRGTITDLGSVPGEDSAPTAIDAHGTIVGYAHPAILDPDHALIWQGGRRRDLGAFGSRVKQAIAINSAGQVLVSTFRPDMHAFLWWNGGAREIGRRFTNAHALNDRGWVVGSALFRPRGPQLPFVWRDGAMTALPTLAAGAPPISWAAAVDDGGRIVGGSYGAHGGSRAVLWTLRR